MGWPWLVDASMLLTLCAPLLWFFVLLCSGPFLFVYHLAFFFCLRFHTPNPSEEQWWYVFIGTFHGPQCNLYSTWNQFYCHADYCPWNDPHLPAPPLSHASTHTNTPYTHNSNMQYSKLPIHTCLKFRHGHKSIFISHALIGKQPDLVHLGLETDFIIARLKGEGGQ